MRAAIRWFVRRFIQVSHTVDPDPRCTCRPWQHCVQTLDGCALVIRREARQPDARGYVRRTWAIPLGMRAARFFEAYR